MEKIKDAVNGVLCRSVDDVFITAKQYDERRKSVFRISTGSAEFDKILGGGIESMAITEAYGEYRSGTTARPLPTLAAPLPPLSSLISCPTLWLSNP